jgi:hypothetical protein
MNHKYKNTAYAPKELSRDFNIFFFPTGFICKEFTCNGIPNERNIYMNMHVCTMYVYIKTRF